MEKPLSVDEFMAWMELVGAATEDDIEYWAKYFGMSTGARRQVIFSRGGDTRTFYVWAENGHVCVPSIHEGYRVPERNTESDG